MSSAGPDESELRDWRATVRRFVATEVEPYYLQWERAGIIPKALYLKAGEAGLLCVDLPARYGGAEAPFEFSCVLVEEIARAGFLALSSNISMHSDIVAPYILHLGTEAQKDKYLPRICGR
jgi:acyl-CoA dehydrogenase